MASNRIEHLTMTDEQLLTAYVAGDRDAFAELVQRYQRELFHFLVRFLADRSAADDVFQETFLQVHNSARQFEADRHFRPWLFTIAANKARDFLRSRNRRRMAPLSAMINPSGEDSGEFVDLIQSLELGPDSKIEAEEVQQRVQQTIDRLPENLKEIILLAYFHQFPYKQISEMLDIPLGTVKSRLHSAVGAFSMAWKSANPEPAES